MENDVKKGLCEYLGFSVRETLAFAFYAVMVHNRKERIARLCVPPTVNLLRRGLIDHCMGTEYGTIKWTSNV